MNSKIDFHSVLLGRHSQKTKNTQSKCLHRRFRSGKAIKFWHMNPNIRFENAYFWGILSLHVDNMSLYRNIRNSLSFLSVVHIWHGSMESSFTHLLRRSLCPPSAWCLPSPFLSTPVLLPKQSFRTSKSSGSWTRGDVSEFLQKIWVINEFLSSSILESLEKTRDQILILNSYAWERPIQDPVN